MPVKKWSCQRDGGQAGKEQELLSSMSFIYTQLDQNLVTNLNMRKFSFKSGDEPMIPQLLNGKNRISAPLWSSCCMYLVRCATVTIFLFSSIQYLFFSFCARCLLRSGCAHFGIDAGLLRMWYNIQESEAFCFIWMEKMRKIMHPVAAWTYS